ncbi:MAG: tRNA-dihydrouridine synthase family protein [Lachnospiraceae bacterium]|nr:tRNA-dihydrouridine synthase family protein [Candidatus Darwinimomas equi]
MMKYYLAPMEGITTYVYRKAVRDFFGDGVDKYFTPFFAPQTKRHKSSAAIRGILPENNEGIYLVPQMLTDDAEDFLAFEKDMRSYGYTELNINLGCPSGTVVSKGRGAGFLEHPQKLDHFLEDVFAKTNAEISLKTRLGMHDAEAFPQILEIYNKYPLKELIVHPRVRDEMYSGNAHRDVYRWIKQNSRNPLVYNGDIFRPGDETDGDEPIEDTVMIGRGMIADPSLIRQLKGGKPADRSEMTAFLHRIRDDYIKRDPDERHCMEKLKEIAAYLKASKRTMKARHLEEFMVELDRSIRENPVYG